MIAISASGVAAVLVDSGAGVTALGKGAIAGALIVGVAFLAGFAAIRRSGLAFCGLIMVAAAAVLEFSWLGLTPGLPDVGTTFVLGLFAAAAAAFLSSSINASKFNPIIGGAIFTFALILAGLGVINFVDRVDVKPLLQWGAISVGVMAVILSAMQAFRGDQGARLILPGAALATIAPFVGPLSVVEIGAAGLLPHGLFALGVLAASLVALTDLGGAAGRAPVFGADLNSAPAFSPGADKTHGRAGAQRQRAEIVIDSALGRVLDYAGVAIWDWSPDEIDQTESLPELLGADSNAGFTPEAMRNFIHRDDQKLLEDEVLAAKDGPFDVRLKLFDGRAVRMRGARAAHEEAHEIERIVAFIELVGAEMAPGAGDPAALSGALSTAVNTASTDIQSFDVKEVVAAFQPILSLQDMSVVGYEALARLDGAESDAASVIRAAAHAGKSSELAISMLDQAAEHLAAKRKQDKGNGPFFVAMNVSWSQMKDPAFARSVEDAFKRNGLSKGAIVLELTEGEAIGDAAAATPVFEKLRKIGAGLAFDDFGAGFSCLANLRKYDFDYLKIDKSFAVDLTADAEGSKIVRALAGLGRDMGLKVIVEGVESRETAKAAAKLGCAYGQGFALGKPDRAKQSRKAGASANRADRPEAMAGDATDLTDYKAETDNALPKPKVISEPADGGKSTRWLTRRRSF
ncbi:MAG: EAL domain-containing protein [Pseudomonadota bacterium]